MLFSVIKNYNGLPGSTKSTSLGHESTTSEASSSPQPPTPANATDGPHPVPVDPVTHSPQPTSTSPSNLPHPIDEFCPKPWSRVPDDAFPVLWRIVYWSSQLLTWFVVQGHISACSLFTNSMSGQCINQGLSISK